MTSNSHHDRRVASLGRYWDALAQGQPIHADTLDPALAATLQHLHAREDAPAANPDFAARLLADLEEQIGATRNAVLAQQIPFPPVISVGTSRDSRPSGAGLLGPAGTAPRAPVRWVSAHLATAALLVLTLLAGYIATGSSPLGWGNEIARWLSVPSLVPTPAMTGDPATQLGLLTRATVAEVPPSAGYVGIERWTYPPNSGPVTTPPLTGPMLMFVTTGRLTVSLDGEGAMLRGATQDQLGPSLAATTGGISAGDTLLVPANARMTTSNDSSTAAAVLVVPIIKYTVHDRVLPFDQTTVEYQGLANGRSEFSPPPAAIELRRARLQPGEIVPAPQPGTFQLVGAESKYLGYLRRAPDGAVTNLEQEPLAVLIVTITQ